MSDSCANESTSSSHQQQLLYSAKEIEKLKEFRSRVSSALVHDYQKEDSYLIRWLRARQLNLDKAEKMLLTSLEWRKVNNMDDILQHDEIPQKFKDLTPLAYCGVDESSECPCPVFLYLMGRHDTRSMLEEVGIEKYVRFNIIMLEKTLQIMKDLSLKYGKPVTQFIEIIDVEGYSYRQLSSKLYRDGLAQLQTTVDSNYPELLKHATLINTPSIFNILFKIMKPLIPKETLAKVDIYGPDPEVWKKALAQKYPLDLIPKKWGGTLEGSDEFCSQSNIWFFGPLHRSFYSNLTEDGFTRVKVKAGEKVQLDFEVTSQQLPGALTWKFKSESYDIGFGIVFGEEEKILMKRVNSHISIEEGFIDCNTAGKYVVVFDNTYSYTRAKIVHYQISFVSNTINDTDTSNK